MNRNSIIRLVSAGLMIVVGTVIYLCSRQEIIFFRLVPDCIIDIFKGRIPDTHSVLHYIVVYCLPDGLWYGALLLFQSAFLENSLISRKIFQISVALPFFLEVLQLLDCVPGTFDPLDLLIYFVILIIFILCLKPKQLHLFN